MCKIAFDAPLTPEALAIWNKHQGDLLSNLGVSDAKPETVTYSIVRGRDEKYYFKGTASDGRKFHIAVIVPEMGPDLFADCGFD